MAEAAKNQTPVEIAQNQRLAADIPPSNSGAAPAQNYEQCVAERQARGILTADIACDTRRLANATTLGSVLDTADILQKNPKAKTSYSDYDLAIRVMKDSARKGQIGDPFVGELAKRGVSRVRFKEENKQIVRDKDGNPIIAYDAVANLVARISNTANKEKPPTEIPFVEGALPIAINKTRVCIAGFADAMMRLDKTLDLNTHIKTLNDNKIPFDIKEVTDLALELTVNNERAERSDKKLEETVKLHLANKSNASLKQVDQDCGSLALRQSHDEGFRYQGLQMITPPTTPPSVTLVKPEKPLTVKR